MQSINRLIVEMNLLKMKGRNLSQKLIMHWISAFFCLYGLNLRSDSSYEDDPVTHKNTSRGDYQTKEQCADVFQYILPYAKASSVSTHTLFLSPTAPNPPPPPPPPSLSFIFCMSFFFLREDFFFDDGGTILTKSP
jgi:hypothetical protein